MKTTDIKEIERLLTLSEIAQSKVEYDNSGRCINPMQKAAANRLYKRARKIKGQLTDQEFINIHRLLIKTISTC